MGGGGNNRGGKGLRQRTDRSHDRQTAGTEHDVTTPRRISYCIHGSILFYRNVAFTSPRQLYRKKNEDIHKKSRYERNGQTKDSAHIVLLVSRSSSTSHYRHLPAMMLSICCRAVSSILLASSWWLVSPPCAAIAPGLSPRSAAPPNTISPALQPRRRRNGHGGVRSGDRPGHGGVSSKDRSAGEVSQESELVRETDRRRSRVCLLGRAVNRRVISRTDVDIMKHGMGGGRRCVDGRADRRSSGVTLPVHTHRRWQQ